ncbi:MAG TPA: hypothetical protein VMH28_18970 [Candidatus Acidoferrales bacterium]|nr:hypothetical protein [Candidatus Acidoferrales bacterium]
MHQSNGTLHPYQLTFGLGIMQGQLRAYGSVAGRCSAAYAICLRQIREGELYLLFAANWDQYCVDHLKISRRTANRIIACLEEFGTAYFEVAELTGITPKEYSAIRDSIDDDGIHIDGDVIALVPSNCELIVGAVARLQAQARPAEPEPASIDARIVAVEKRACQLAAAFRRLAGQADEFERLRLLDALRKVIQSLSQIELEAI